MCFKKLNYIARILRFTNPENFNCVEMPIFEQFDTNLIEDNLKVDKSITRSIIKE